LGAFREDWLTNKSSTSPEFSRHPPRCLRPGWLSKKDTPDAGRMDASSLHRVSMSKTGNLASLPPWVRQLSRLNHRFGSKRTCEIAYQGAVPWRYRDCRRSFRISSPKKHLIPPMHLQPSALAPSRRHRGNETGVFEIQVSHSFPSYFQQCIDTSAWFPGNNTTIRPG